jgi:hypothetical protein
MISACSVITFLSLPTIFLNGISVFTIMKCPQLKEKIAYFLIMVQSLADLAVGFVGLPSLSYLCFSQALGSPNCLSLRLIANITILPFLISLITLTVMSIERYISIVHPIKHRNMVTKRRIKHFLVGGFLLMLTATITLSFLQSQMFERFLIICMLLFILLALFVYTKIFLAIKKLNPPGNIGDISTSNGQNQRLFLKKIQQGKSCFLAVGCFLGCFLAGICLLATVSFVDKAHSFALRAWAGAVMNLNSSLNSIIFFWTRPLLRNETFKILKKGRTPTAG